MDHILHTPLEPEKQPGYGPREVDEPLLAGEEEPFYDRASSTPEVHAEARNHSDGEAPSDNVAEEPSMPDLEPGEDATHAGDIPADPPEAFEDIGKDLPEPRNTGEQPLVYR
jgi:hypothetical protein